MNFFLKVLIFFLIFFIAEIAFFKVLCLKFPQIFLIFLKLKLFVILKKIEMRESD